MSIAATVEAYLLLGSNLGDRVTWLDQALDGISREVGSIIRTSSIYETAAWGNEDQPGFLNLAVAVATLLSPSLLLETLQQIEIRLGRQRKKKWEARTIDVDILFYGHEVIDEPALQVPHPHLPNRRFALTPLQEIAPDLVHPVLRKTMTELLRDTPDQLAVTPYKTECYEQHKL